MKKIVFLAFFLMVITHNVNAMLSRPLHEDRFATRQVKAMIQYDRANMLKNWLDQSSAQCTFTLVDNIALCDLAYKHGAKESLDVLVKCMKQNQVIATVRTLIK